MKTLRQLFITVLFISVWIIVFYVIRSFAPEVQEQEVAQKVVNAFEMEAQRIERTAPFIYGGAIAGFGMALGISSIANRILKRWFEKKPS